MATAQNIVDDMVSGPLEKWGSLRVLVVMLCFLLNMMDGADLLVMAFIAPILSSEWGIPPESLGAIFSASLAGMAVGCLFIAPLSDQIGRKPLIMGALALVTVSMVWSAHATTVSELVIARLVVGLGVGSIGVTMTAMASEYAPEHHSSFAVGFVQAGWPLGSIITAFLTVSFMDVVGWRHILMAVGVLSSILLLLISFVMPESRNFLRRRQPKGALDRINQLNSRLNEEPVKALPPKPAAAPKIPLADLFQGDLRRPGILLWCAVALGYFVLYFAISWIPKLAVAAGLALDDAIYAGATYNLGAFLGTTLMGWLAIRFDLPKVIAALFFSAAIALVLYGNLSLPLVMTLFAACLVGVTVQGGFNGFWALAAKLYPLEIRATGIGWALGVGRIGAVLGPLVGGVLVGAEVPVGGIFLIYALPAFGAAALCLTIHLPEKAE